jgi:hypothetical protein
VQLEKDRAAMNNDENPSGKSNVWITAIMMLLGILMLLPGLCGVFYGGMTIRKMVEYGHFFIFDGGIAEFSIVGLVVGVIGVLLVRASIRRTRR